MQTPEETLARGSGSCRDSAGCWCRLLRHLGLAARFVSGYLIQLTPDVKSLDGPIGADGGLHRPARLGRGLPARAPAGSGSTRPPACSPAKGTSRSRRRRTTPSAAPITGAVDECEAEFDHEMTVRRIYEAPRVTKPYTEEQWQAIDALRPRRRPGALRAATCG